MTPGCAVCVAYMSPMNFRPLYPVFASEIGEKSAPVVGLNDVLSRFRQVLEVVERPFARDFESAAYANFATPAAFNFNSLPKPARKPIGHVAYLSPMATGFFESSSISARCAAKILFAA